VSDGGATPRTGRFTSRGQAALRFVAQRGLLKPVAWASVRVTVVGEDRLDGLEAPFIVAANHASHLDTPLIMGALPREHSRYLAAGAAADYFFDVWWRRGLTALFFNAFPVDRSGRNPRAVRARDLLAERVPLLVFPEGTRSKDGSIGSFKPGAASLAISAGVPVLPVGIVGTHIAHPRGSNWPKPGRLPVGVVFGEPMTAQPGETPVDFMKRIRARVVELVAEQRERILGPDPHPEGES